MKTGAESEVPNLCGLWVDPDGIVHLCLAGEGESREARPATLSPFIWTSGAPAEDLDGASSEGLAGIGAFRTITHARDSRVFTTLVKHVKADGFETVRPLQSQYLLQNRVRLFAGMHFSDLRRCQLDIETASTGGGFPDPRNPGDRVLAIGLRFNGRDRTLVLGESSDAAEKGLLEELNRILNEEDPDVIEGHNIFKFDLDFLRQRCRLHKVTCAWGRFGQKASFRNSRVKLAERWIDFPRCDLPGRTVVDTLLLVQLHDITAREMTGYGLKEAAVYFGITLEDGGDRTYIEGSRIQDAWREERDRFLAYLADDLRETEGIASLLLPTYFEQARTFPMLLQDATLRGTTAKIDLLFLEEYYHARHAISLPAEVTPFEGGYTRSFESGVFRNVLHFDVASLYPSLLLKIGRNPRSDPLGVFIPMLRRLRDYRLKYKTLARTSRDEVERAEAAARQANFKILINSFYGYLGFPGARFGDGDLAAEVTRQGRELLQALIDAFVREGCVPLEADTDGIYLSSERYAADPEALLKQVSAVLPPGIDLEFDGDYRSMFCYKAKNYALFDGNRIILKGSALRSRGIEPYLRKLTGCLIAFLLKGEGESPLDLIDDYRKRIRSGTIEVTELSRSELLGQNPEAYEALMASGGKPRRAAAEVALQLTPRPRMGDRISFYITPKSKGRTSDWQRARAVQLFDAGKAPYDADHYLKKLDDWLERYGEFLGLKPTGGEQGELL
jgi:DNA polymerase I